MDFSVYDTITEIPDQSRCFKCDMKQNTLVTAVLVFIHTPGKVKLQAKKQEWSLPEAQVETLV